MPTYKGKMDVNTIQGDVTHFYNLLIGRKKNNLAECIAYILTKNMKRKLAEVIKL